MIPDRMFRFKTLPSRKAFGLAALMVAASLGPAGAQQPAPAPAIPAETPEDKARREQDLRAAFSRAAVEVLELSTEDDLVDSVRRFAELRKRRTQLGGGAARGAAGGLRHLRTMA